MQKLSVVITSYNKESQIAKCINSAKHIADEIIVLDSFSTDNTVAIAKSMGVIVEQLRFIGYVNQKNMAISMAKYDMVLLLDADEALSEELKKSILEAKQEFKYKAYAMNRTTLLGKSFVKHGLWYPDRKLRLFDRHFGKCGGLDPHDKVLMTGIYKVKHLKGDLLHYAFSSIEDYKTRNEEMSTLFANSLFEKGIKRPWYKMVLSPIWSFLNGYILRLGFLDGYNGLVIAIQTFKASFKKYNKLRKLYNNYTDSNIAIKYEPIVRN